MNKGDTSAVSQPATSYKKSVPGSDPARWRVLDNSSGSGHSVYPGMASGPTVGLHRQQPRTFRMPTGSTVYGGRPECRGERAQRKQEMDRSLNRSLAG